MSRYLINTGARNWNDTANWSTTSGGAGGASVPTLSDAVIFDQNSGVGDVTLNANAVCASFNSVGLTSIVRVVSSVYTFSNYGDLTLNGTLSKFAFTGTAYYYQKGTGGITTNGNLFLALNRLYIDGVGITVTNLDDCDLNTTSAYLFSGHWNTNSKRINIYGFISTPSATRVLSLGSSIVTISASGFSATNYTGFTFNSDTSTIILTNTGGVSGLNTFYNLEIIGYSYISAQSIIFSNQTVSNNLTFTGSNASNYRLLIASNTIGTPRTITCNGTVSASNVDFRDITLAGTCNKDLSAITGGSGDCGGNSGIIFTTAQPQYFKKYASTANVGDAANWFSDLALTVAGRVPLPQDLGSKFLATSFDRTCTVSCNVPRIPCLDLSEVVNTVTWSLANAIEVYGSYMLGNSITQSGNFALNPMGRGNYFLNTYNKTLYSLNVYAFNGVYVSNSDIYLTGGFVIFNGQVDFNYYSLSATVIQSAANTCKLTLRNGTFTCRVNSGYSFSFGGLTVIEPMQSTLLSAPTSGSSIININLPNFNYNIIRYSGTHTATFDIISSNIISELIIASGRKVRFTAGTTQTIAKATIGTNVTLDCITASTYTLALADITTAENANIKGCIAPVSKFFAEANSVDSGSNTNVVFGDYFTPQEIIIENRIN